MGKIRVKTIGDEEQEQKEKLKAEKRAEAKKQAKSTDAAEEPKEEKVTKGKDYVKKTATKKQKRSEKYQKAALKIEKLKKYSLDEALSILKTINITSFDETVELHINTIDKGLSGSVTLPHGTGKERKIVIANAAVDPKGVDDLVKAVEGGTIAFDVLIATPDSMPKLAKIARILGPRGLMPNPKNGTVSPKPDEVAKKFAGGQINFKTEAKFPIMHLAVGKLSFDEKNLTENIKAAIAAVNLKNVKNITLKSTMSPGIKLDTATV